MVKEKYPENPYLYMQDDEDPDYVKRGWKLISREILENGDVNEEWDTGCNKIEITKRRGETKKIDFKEEEIIKFWKDDPKEPS